MRRSLATGADRPHLANAGESYGPTAAPGSRSL